MADYSEPPEKGEAYSNGYDIEERRITASLARLDERTTTLNQTVARLQGEIKHLPTKGTLGLVLGALIAIIALVSIAYWNGISGKFEGVSGRFEATNAKIDGINGRLDSLSRSIDRLTQPPAPQPSAAQSSTRHH
jgi:hypothetical protein